MTALNYLVVLAVDLSRPQPRTTVTAASPEKGEGPPTSLMVHTATAIKITHTTLSHPERLINTQLRRVSVLFSLVALNMTGYTQQYKKCTLWFSDRLI